METNYSSVMLSAIESVEPALEAKDTDILYTYSPSSVALLFFSFPFSFFAFFLSFLMLVPVAAILSRDKEVDPTCCIAMYLKGKPIGPGTYIPSSPLHLNSTNIYLITSSPAFIWTSPLLPLLSLSLPSSPSALMILLESPIVLMALTRQEYATYLFFFLYLLFSSLFLSFLFFSFLSFFLSFSLSLSL